MSTNAYRPPNPKPKNPQYVEYKAPKPKKERKKEPAGTHVDCSGRLYTLETLLGSGGFGDVYKVSYNGQFFAMKTERFDEVPEQRRRLKVEYNVYSAIQSSKPIFNREYIFPKMHEFGKTKTFSFMIMEIVGPSLYDIRRKLLNDQNPSPRSVAEIARQTLWSIEALHDLGWTHRDIKPHNYAIGLPPRESNIVMLDFGTARMYREKNGKMRAPRNQPVWKGTPRYASARGLKRLEQSRRDDLEIWCFMMLEFYYLRNMHWSYGAFTPPMVIAMKEKMMSDAGPMREKGLITCPARFCEIMVYVSTLTYSAAVDFKKIHGILEEIIKDEKIDMSLPLDWVGKEMPVDKKKGKLPRKEEKAARMEANFSGKGSARDASSLGSSIAPSTGREPNKKSAPRSPPLDPKNATLAEKKKRLEDEIRKINIQMDEGTDKRREKEGKPRRCKKMRRRDEEDEESSSSEDSDSEYSRRRHQRRRRKHRPRKRRTGYRTREESDRDRRRRREDSDRDRRRKREEDDDKEDENVKDTQKDEVEKGSPDRVKDTPRKRERRRTSDDKKRTGAKNMDGSCETEEKGKRKEKDAKRGSTEDVKEKKNEKGTEENEKDKGKKNSKEIISPEKASPAKAEPVKTQETPSKDSDNKKK